jgi:serine/threonine protein phosphatase PrpC/ribosomal protein L37E
MDMAVSEATAIVCAKCGEQAFAGDLFCESCGEPLPGTEAAAVGDGAAVSDEAAIAAATAAAEPSAGGGPDAGPGTAAGAGTAATSAAGDELTSSRPCPSCGGSDFLDGYCTRCGAPAVKERDHFAEQPAAWVAALSDRGIRHQRNEDGMALSALPEPGSRAVLVVCDGVSSALDSDVASLAAARAARDVLTTSQETSPSIAGRISTWSDLLVLAAEAANAETVEVAKNPTGRPDSFQNSPPSCTFVAAVVDGPLVVVGWVGDSRAYWLPDHGAPEQMTTDDSWAAEQMLVGIPREQAESSPQAHAITRWLGSDSPDIVPTCIASTPTGPGWLLICSDGLWNYCSAPGDMGELFARTVQASGGDPALTAAELVDWANEQGGQDNITVALARLDTHG